MPAKTSPTPADGCPAWADELISYIRDLEIKLGNIRPPEAWKQTNVSDLYKRLAGDPEAFDASVAESLFAQVCKRLRSECFTAAQIVLFVNNRIQSGGTLPYCNADEVCEAVGETF